MKIPKIERYDLLFIIFYVYACAYVQNTYMDMWNIKLTMRNILTCAGCKTDFWNGVKYTWLSSSTCSLFSSMLVSSNPFQGTQRQIGRLSADNIWNFAISDNIFASFIRDNDFSRRLFEWLLNLQATLSRKVFGTSSKSSWDLILLRELPQNIRPSATRTHLKLSQSRLIVDHKKMNIDLVSIVRDSCGDDLASVNRLIMNKSRFNLTRRNTIGGHVIRGWRKANELPAIRLWLWGYERSTEDFERALPI